MNRKNKQPFIINIRQIDQNKIIRFLVVMFGIRSSTFIAIVHTGLIPVVTISNIDRAFHEGVLNLVDQLSIGDPPHLVFHAQEQCINNGFMGFGKCLQQIIYGFTLVSIEAKNTADIGFGFSEQV